MSNHGEPVISLVIPTRERCETLKYTLKTAVDQASTEYEIIVSDNFSQDDTKKIVEEFRDNRIKYINTGKRLSMCDNWDFALEHLRGEYVIFIGDDDGVMPGAIDRLQEIIRKQPSAIYFWQAHQYTWPIDNVEPLVDFVAPAKKPFVMDLKKLVKFSIESGAWRYYRLPVLYHSAVSKNILDTIRRRTGRVFHSTNPDVFMSFALPVFADKAINVGESITVNGRSAKSNGASSISKNGQAVLDRFIREYPGYQMHKTLYPDVSFQVNMIPDSALVAMDLFPEYYKGMTFNYSAMWAYIMRLTKFNNWFGIMKRRKLIKQYHSFSVVKFTFHSLIHKISAIRQNINSKKVIDSERDIPSNIFDFARMMASRKEYAHGNGKILLSADKDAS